MNPPQYDQECVLRREIDQFERKISLTFYVNLPEKKTLKQLWKVSYVLYWTYWCHLITKSSLNWTFEPFYWENPQNSCQIWAFWFVDLAVFRFGLGTVSFLRFMKIEEDTVYSPWVNLLKYIITINLTGLHSFPVHRNLMSLGFVVTLWATNAKYLVWYTTFHT